MGFQILEPACHLLEIPEPIAIAVVENNEGTHYRNVVFGGEFFTALFGIIPAYCVSSSLHGDLQKFAKGSGILPHACVYYGRGIICVLLDGVVA